MGDPKRIRRKYQRPNHPWEMDRIQGERDLTDEYGLKNKKEIWKMNSLLKGFKDQVKKLNAMEGEQAEKEKEQLMNKLINLGIVDESDRMDDVLGLDIRSVMERRLQSVVYRQGLARSMEQARQFVVHEHIAIDGEKMTVPSYLVKVDEEVHFAENSPLQDEMHPERRDEKPSDQEIESPEDMEKDEIASTEERKKEEESDKEEKDVEEESDEKEETDEDEEGEE